jgi:TolB-like protein/Flp pilus assembly protein TadD
MLKATLASVTNEARTTYEKVVKSWMAATLGLGNMPDDPEKQDIRFDRFILDTARGCLIGEGGEIWLRPRSFQVLRYLARNARRLVAKEELFEALWARAAVTDDALVQCISEIRHALGPDGRRLIRTVPRRGYMLDLPADTPAQPRLLGRGKDARQPPVEFAHRLSIAVGRLRNVGDDPACDVVAEALTANLITDLTSIRDSMILTPNNVIACIDQDRDLRQIARERDVRYVFTGTVQGFGGRLRVNCQLVDARVGTNLWAERFEYEGSDPWTWQGRVTRHIARILKFGLVEAASHHSEAERSGGPDAIDLTMQAVVLFSRFVTRADVADARVLFQRALRLDPSSVQALVGFAGTHILELSQLWAEDWETQLAQAEVAIARAMELDPNSAEVRYTRANLMLLRAEAEQAIAEYRVAVELNPTFSQALSRIGQATVVLGRPADAFEPLFAAVRLNPRNGMSHFFLGMACFHLGDDDKAVAWFEEALAIDQRSALARSWLAGIYALHNRLAAARVELAEFDRVHPRQTIASLRASQLSRNPETRAQRERLYDGLLRAGMRAV